MLHNKTIAVVVPCYNEETQIGMVIETMPEFVDRIIIVNDASKDKTSQVVLKHVEKSKGKGLKVARPAIVDSINIFDRADVLVSQKEAMELPLYPQFTIVNNTPESDRVILLNHKFNFGKGAGIITGYKFCKDWGFDCIAAMDGDGQMDPRELESICTPVVSENIDYVKGNRLIHRSAWLIIPKVRFFGNSVLSILTKLASGYWRVSDTQTGYTAISRKAINSFPIHSIYKSYGYPNDILVKLNIAMCTLREVEIKPIYNVGEQSKMNIAKVIPTVSYLLLKSFFKRLWVKYLFRDFHPLFLLYNFSFIMFFGSVPLGIKIVSKVVHEAALNPITLLGFGFLILTAIQFLLFAMWMDIQDNERLYR